MKALLFLLVHLLMLTTGHSLVGSQEEEDAGFRKWESYLGTCHSADPDEALTELGRGLLKLSQPSIYHERPRADRLSKLFADEIMSRKGHAQFFVDQFEVKRPGEASKKPGFGYRNTRMYSTETLMLLPSLENAQLMSDLLDIDQSVESENGERPSRRAFPLCDFAAAVLGEIIEGPLPEKSPIGLRLGREWLVWKEEVQAGRLAFQLKDDPRWYDLEGPIGKAKASGISPDGRMAKSQGVIPASDQETSPQKGSASARAKGRAGLWGAMALVGVALLAFFFRQRIWRAKS